MKKVAVSVFGPDRPGILATVSNILFERGCNIENVTQTILQSEFSGIFIAEIPDEMSAETLHDLLETTICPMDLQAYVKYLKTGLPALCGKASEPFVITTRGPDRKGLVAKITRIIANYGVNVTNLQAVFRGGDNPFDNMMIYEVDVPTDIDQHAFHRDLRQQAAELELIVSIQHQKIFEAINRV